MSNAVLKAELEEITEVTEKISATPFSNAVLKASYHYCRAVTKSHYENFPVASMILPRPLRPAIEAIYAFSRLADDFADEKEYKGMRLEKLEEWTRFLLDQTRPTHPVFIALHDTISRYSLSMNLFSDLLQAFKMDVSKSRYTNFSDVLSYCRYSANPVGRLVLELFALNTPKNLALSDSICTGLQLANFWQDVAVDLTKDRIYLPQDETERFGVNLDDLYTHKTTDAFKRLMGFQIERTRDIFLKGKELGLALDGKLGVEIRLTWLTGTLILRKIQEAGYDIFNHRPKLTKMDFAKMFFIALSKRRYDKFVP